MKSFLRFAWTIARRDFMAVVGSPTFLIFLLTPVFFLAMSSVLGSSIASGMKQGDRLNRLAAIVAPSHVEAVAAADKRMRTLGGTGNHPPVMVFASDGKDEARTNTLFGEQGADYIAILSGPLEKPSIRHEASSGAEAAYLAELAEQVLRAGKARISAETPVSTPKMIALQPVRAGVGERIRLGSTAVLALFMLTLMLAGQAVGMLAEEKSNKVIEIIAAAAPLESVFFGKLVGMFSVALLFVTFWAGIAGISVAAFGDGGTIAGLDAAVGLPAFLILCALYFATAYMLLGAVFLGIGAMAATMRELQMMSLPITVFQMAMFALSSQAAGSPGSSLARFAEIFPFSSPFAMAARGASDPALWPHVLALGWQVLWVGLVILFSARLFRLGVLKAGGGWRALMGVKAA